jgi:hypothetical protein
MTLLFSASAFATTGRTTDKTYKTMKAAASATAAFYLHKDGQNFDAHKLTAQRVLSRKGSVREIKVAMPDTPFGYPIGTINVKVEKVKGGWKGFTDTDAKPIFLK